MAESRRANPTPFAPGAVFQDGLLRALLEADVTPSRHPSIARAVDHADGLRRHLVAIGMVGEAACVDHVIDELVPGRRASQLS